MGMLRDGIIARLNWREIEVRIEKEKFEICDFKIL